MNHITKCVTPAGCTAVQNWRSIANPWTQVENEQRTKGTLLTIYTILHYDNTAKHQ